MDTNEVKERVIPILRQHNVIAASVFGSVARGEAGAESDVDLLVKIGSMPFGIWGFVALKQDLEKALQKKVDIISEGALNPRLKNKIKNDLISIYERA
jgi:predicted nucleotidyltransferase